MTWPLVKVISGAQTGADQAFLFAAEALGIPTGGTCPLRCRTESGERPDLIARFKLTESPSSDYPVRTLANVKAADGTAVFGDVLETGSALTCRYARVEKGHEKLIVNPTAQQLRDWIMVQKIAVLNGAGNRLSRKPALYDHVVTVLMQALRAPGDRLIVDPPLIGALRQAPGRRNGWLGGR